jgi:flagellin-like hook-associated protein FlgL
MAYCSINDADSGTVTESGKFILYGVQGGEQLNNVDIVAKKDINQSEAVKVTYDEASKRLVITVNSDTVTLSEAIAKINENGIFKAEYDYSFNNTAAAPGPPPPSTGPGLETFGSVFGSGNEVVIGNTGTTGGHLGGVLEVYVGGTDAQIDANNVIDAINNNEITRNLFKASAIGNGEGIINFRKDNIREVTGPDGLKRNEVNMLTAILGSSGDDPGLMVVHLATDANGTVITTARDLVAYFDTLTAEQLRGISVSVIRPPGVDNLDRIWTYDSCGNVIEEQLCDNPYGLGLLAPTMYIDDCGIVTYYPIEFYSYGEDVKPGNAYGSVIAANGIDASLDIHAKVAGSEYNGVGFQYLRLDDPLAEAYADYDPAGKMITVYIQGDGMATAAEIKSVIENSAATKDLFSVTLPGDGSGFVTLNDDYLVLRNGTYDAGYRGGAIMQGAADADEHRLVFESLNEGSKQWVRVRALSGDFVVRDIAGITTDVDYGEDMIARLNGNKMVADGRTLSIDTSMLKMSVTLQENVQGGDRVQFTITGGGATFQLGPDVVTNQQIRLGIQSVSTATLGGASGRLYMLSDGEAAALANDTKLADRIVQEAIMAVAVTRGRLGAIQRNTLDPTISALQDQLQATTAAEAQISNADFAEESSKLMRTQILVQAGMQALQLANQFPQYAAQLLG